jgi:hypothetical protein
MPRWVVVCVLAALAALPSRAMAADCAAPACPVSSTCRPQRAELGEHDDPGRVAAGGNAVSPVRTSACRPR